jgi:hypothetical protein
MLVVVWLIGFIYARGGWLIGFIYARGGLVNWVYLCSWWFGYLGLFMLVVVWLIERCNY